MIHYHGTPITPRAELLKLAGRSFCVRYGEHRDVEVCHQIGQSVMLDNGAYPAWTKGKPTDWRGFVKWAKPWLDYRTTWAVMPDVIDGTEEDNDLLSAWLYNHDAEVWRRCAPVWHMHESIDRLKYLCQSHERVCLGSSGEYSKPGSASWTRRMEEAMNAVCGNGPAPTWLHMLRGLGLCGGPYPFASADSTNVARNHVRNRKTEDIKSMTDRIDATQCPARWTVPQFKEGDRVWSHYTYKWGTIERVGQTCRGQKHGVTGSALPDTTWYFVRNDDGTTDSLDDAHGDWDMARIVPPAVAVRFGYGADPH